MTDSGRFDEVLEALADPYRRQLLLALIQHNPQDDEDSDPLNIHPDGDDTFSKMNIFMGHLPKLDKMGIIEWKKEEDEIIKGPDWAEFEPLLQLIADNRDELPEEWFERAPAE